MSFNAEFWDYILPILNQLDDQTLSQLLASLWGKRQLNLWDNILDTINGVISSIQDAAVTVINVGLAAVLGLVTGKRQLDGLIASLLDSLQSVGSSLLESVTPIVQNLQDQLINSALNAAQSVLGTLSNISGILQGRDIFGSIIETINGVISTIQDAAVTVINVGLAAVLGLVTGKRQLNLWDNILDTINGVISSIQDAAVTVINVGLAAVLGLVTGKRQLDGLLASLLDSLQSVGSSLLESVTPIVQNLQDQLINSALNAAQSVLGTLSNISGILQG